MGIICHYYTVSKSLDERICVDNNVLTIHMVSWSLWAKNGEIEQLIIYGSGNGCMITKNIFENTLTNWLTRFLSLEKIRINQKKFG